MPVVNRAMNGSTSDVEWNRKAIDYLQQLYEKGFTEGIYVADSKLVTRDLITQMNSEDKKILFVSRCPVNFENKLSGRMIEKAYTDGEWEEYGQFHGGKKATKYNGCEITENVCGEPMRLLVLESSMLQSKAEEKLKQKELEVQPLIKKIEKDVSLCQADAEKKRDKFLSLKELSLFNCPIEIEKKTKKKWPRGRRGPDTKPTYEDTFHIRITEVTRKQEQCQAFLQRESCIVLISNVFDMNGRELLQTYKGQHVVENSFRLLKAPQLASVIYLKNPERIQALTMLLTFSLLIRALIQFKLREGLKIFNEENPGVELRVGWTNTPLKTPTFKLFYEHSINCCFEREDQGQYSFAWPSTEAEKRVATLLKLMDLTLEDLLE